MGLLRAISLSYDFVYFVLASFSDGIHSVLLNLSLLKYYHSLFRFLFPCLCINSRFPLLWYVLFRFVSLCCVFRIVLRYIYYTYVSFTLSDEYHRLLA